MELKRGDRLRVQTEIVEFIALPFPFSGKLKIWSLHVPVSSSCAETAKKFTKKRNARAELLNCSLNLFLFDVPVAVAVVDS